MKKIIKKTESKKGLSLVGKKNEEDHQEDRIKEGFISRRNYLRNRNHLHPRRSNPFQLHPHLQKRNRCFRRNLINKDKKQLYIITLPPDRPGLQIPGRFLCLVINGSSTRKRICFGKARNHFGYWRANPAETTSALDDRKEWNFSRYRNTVAKHT